MHQKVSRSVQFKFFDAVLLHCCISATENDLQFARGGGEDRGYNGGRQQRGLGVEVESSLVLERLSELLMATASANVLWLLLVRDLSYK